MKLNNQSIKDQYQKALAAPLSYRCTQLKQLLATSSLKELKILFPKLVEDIFGFHTKNDWGMISTLKSNDFHTLRKFLAPDGPLLQLVYKLLNNHQPSVYEFPILCLPQHSQHMIKIGDVPTFYRSKVQELSNHVSSSNLLLNSFQYYFFHFAYYIVHSSRKYTTESVKKREVLYSHLLKDYLAYFLPVEGVPVPLDKEPTASPPPTSPFRSTSWPTPTNARVDYPLTSTPTSYLQSQPKPRCSLLKPEIISSFNDLSSNFFDNSGNTSTTVELWQSEEFVAILSEFYMSQVSLENPRINFFRNSFVPNENHIWMVRIFVKHSHYFSNSLLTANHLLETNPPVIDPMHQLKSCILLQYIHKEMVTFLKIILDHWPLDASFLEPLKMWLSFIQPWHYINPRVVADQDKYNTKWIKFISDNFVLYTPVLIRVLCRFSRMDLSCPQNATMLLKVSKVFSQEKFDHRILAVEESFQLVECVSSKQNSSYSSYATPCGMYSDSTTFHQEQFNEEAYIPLMSELVISQVTHLLKEIAIAYGKVSSYSTNSTSGFLNQFFNLFSDEDRAYKHRSTDRKKLCTYLEESMRNFCKLFKLPSVTLLKQSFTSTHTTEQNLLKSCFYEIGNQKIPIMKNLWALKKPIYVYYGEHPDHLPVRTHELRFLVKFLADVSSYVNTKYSQEIQALYFNPSIMGHMVQQLLAPPVTYHKVIKSKSLRSVRHESIQLPPRVQLRCFANKYRVFSFVFYMILMYYLGFHQLPALTFLLVFFMTVVFLKALFHYYRPNKENMAAL